jgi:hypothetical protein
MVEVAGSNNYKKGSGKEREIGRKEERRSDGLGMVKRHGSRAQAVNDDVNNASGIR